MGLFRRKPKKQPSKALARRVPVRRDAMQMEVRRLNAELEQVSGQKQQMSLTAAGQHVLNGQATLLRRLIQPWQIRAFGYYDILGEIKYASQFYSRSLANLRLYAAIRLENGDIVELEPGMDGGMPPGADKAVAALARIRDPGGGGRSGLLGAYGRLMFLVGETYLFVSMNPETELEQWEMLSTDEIRLNDGLYTRFKAPSLPATQFVPAPNDQFELVAVDQHATEEQRLKAAELGVTNEAIAYRLWKRHPRFSGLADSTMQGVLELCEELVLLTQAVRARARSRLAGSGVLFIDDRIGETPQEAAPDEDPLEDPFIADLTEAMTTPIVDEGTASAVVPLVVRVRVPDGMKLSDLVHHLQIVDPTQLYPETGLRLECIRRIAIGLDMPAEILEGFADVNHWNAWAVDESSWKAHLQPVAQQLVEDLTSAYLAPYLKEEGVENWSSYVIAYDAASVINHPDRFRDAKEAYDRRAISKAALRDAGGFDDNDAMPDGERAETIGVAVRDPGLAWFGTPTVRGGDVEIAPGEVVEPGQGEPTGAATGADVEKGPPPGGPNQPPPEDVIGSAIEAARIEGAAYMALLRAREAAGNRILNLARRDPEMLAAIEGVQSRDIAATLGTARVRSLIGGAKEADLVMHARPLVAETLRLVGVTQQDVIDGITDTIERHAVRTLYEAHVQLNGSFAGYVQGLLNTRRR